MFSLRRPMQSSIRRNLEAAATLPVSYGIALNTQCGPDNLNVPEGFIHDHMRSEIGHGAKVFESARAAFQQWRQFDLGWVRVANPEVKIEPDTVVAVETHTLA